MVDSARIELAFPQCALHQNLHMEILGIEPMSWQLAPLEIYGLSENRTRISAMRMRCITTIL